MVKWKEDVATNEGVTTGSTLNDNFICLLLQLLLDKIYFLFLPSNGNLIKGTK